MTSHARPPRSARQTRAMRNRERPGDWARSMSRNVAVFGSTLWNWRTWSLTFMPESAPGEAFAAPAAAAGRVGTAVRAAANASSFAAAADTEGAATIAGPGAAVGRAA